MANQSWAPQSPDLSAYRPKSPDLSSFKPQSNTTSWAPQSPDISGFGDYKHPQITHGYQSQPTSFSLDAGWDQRDQTIGGAPYQPNPYSNYQQPGAYQGYHPDQMPATTRSRHVKDEDQDWTPNAGQQHFAPSAFQYPQDTKPFPPTSRPRVDTRGIEVKTKFPTARIKRIMQADEDVGKVAQVTPVVMGT